MPQIKQWFGERLAPLCLLKPAFPKGRMMLSKDSQHLLTMSVTWKSQPLNQANTCNLPVGNNSRPVLAPKLSKKLACKDGQGTGNCAALEVTMSWEHHQHSHVPCAKVLLQHDARRYWDTHASLGVQQPLLCSPENRVKLRNGGVLHRVCWALVHH